MCANKRRGKPKLGMKQRKNRQYRLAKEADLLLTDEVVRCSSENPKHDVECLSDSAPVLVTSNVDAKNWCMENVA